MFLYASVLPEAMPQLLWCSTHARLGEEIRARVRGRDSLLPRLGTGLAGMLGTLSIKNSACPRDITHWTN